MRHFSIFITVVLLPQLMVMLVSGDISEENWFVNGSQTCETYTNKTNLATNAASDSTLHLNTTFYYLTNASDATQNLHLSFYIQNNETNDDNEFVDIKIDFRNNFNDLNYTLKKDKDIILGVVPLPRLRNNVILDIDLNIYLNAINKNMTIASSTKSGENGEKFTLLEDHINFPHHIRKSQMDKLWVSYETNTCSHTSPAFEAQKLEQQKGSLHLQNQFIANDISGAEESRKIYPSTNECQYSKGDNTKQVKTCQSIIKNESMLIFHNTHVNRIATIFIKMNGSDGQINMWTSKEDHRVKLTFLHTSENDSKIKFSLNELYQQEFLIRSPRKASNSISLLIIFPNEDVNSCSDSINPKIYVSNLNGETTLIGSIKLSDLNISATNFEFQVLGRASITEAYVILKEVKESIPSPCSNEKRQDLLNDKRGRKSRNFGDWSSTSLQIKNIAQTNINNIATASQNTIVYVALFASLLVLITIVIGTMYKIGNKRRAKQYWNNIQEVNIANINDRSMTIEKNDLDITKSSSEKRSSSNSKTDSTLSRLGISALVPAVVIQRTGSMSSKLSDKNVQGALRPRSILSVVEMTVEETQDNTNSSTDHRKKLEEKNRTPDTTSSMEEQTTFPTLSKGHGSNDNYFSSFQENSTGLEHYRSEEDILDKLENDTDYGKQAAEVESMESLDDPDDFFGFTVIESINETN